MIEINVKELIGKAKAVSTFSYSPYSKFKVGAALLTKDGRYFVGTNVENAVNDLSICAERSCLFSSYSAGVRKNDIVAFAIYSPKEHMIPPCGACRQVMSELIPIDIPVYLSYGSKDEYICTTVKELLPFIFTNEEL